MNWNNNGSLIKVKTQRARIQIDVVHNVQVRRIELGFSHEDLSYLLGRPKSYVYKIEAFLNDKEYYATDLAKLFDILGCTATELFESEIELHQRCNVGVYQYRDDKGAKVHETYLFQHNKAIMLYQTAEHIPRSKNLKVIKENIALEISKLIQDAFFDNGVEALDIFYLCCEKLKYRFRPIHLGNILHGFIGNVDTPLLKKITDDGRILFIKRGGIKTIFPENL